MPKTENILHATCVTAWSQGVLIVGPSGSGKSSLALRLMAIGAELVADDRTRLQLRDQQLVATCPSPIAGQIEARGIGILAARTAGSAIIRLVVDMGQVEENRLPPERQITLLGQSLPLLHSSVHAHFPAAILQYLKGGRIA